MLIFSALLTGLLLLCRQWRQAIFAGGVLLCTALANTGTKMFFARVRPEVLTDPLTSYSMPSGHASGSFALFLTLAVLAGRGQPPRMRLTWLLVGCIPALAIALSRVYLARTGRRTSSPVRCWRPGLRREPVAESAPAAERHATQSLVAAVAGAGGVVRFLRVRHLPNTMLRYAY